MIHLSAVFAAALLGAFTLFGTPKAKAAEPVRTCGEIMYLGRGAEFWHFQYVAAKRGWRKANARGQRHPKRYRRYGCGVLRFRGHGPEFWHRRLVLLSRHARRHRVTRGARAARLAFHYLGVPYRWGGSSPHGFDCSGLVQYVYRRVGVRIPRTTYAQFRHGQRVTHLRPGDVVFFHMTWIGPSHEGIYVGRGRFIDAPHTGSTVGVRRLAWYRGYAGARRFA